MSGMNKYLRVIKHDKYKFLKIWVSLSKIPLGMKKKAEDIFASNI